MFQIDLYLQPFGKIDDCCAQLAIKFLLVIGFLKMLSFTWKSIKFIHRHFLKGQQNLFKKYGGNDSWAVVTGGSDGIGEQFCHDLAQQGFNICIISRTESKIKEKLKLIQEKSGKNIKTRAVVADLGKMTHISDYHPIAAQLKDIDIGLLICNAGMGIMGPFKELTENEIEGMVTINALHPIYLTKVLLPQLISRKQRSGLIVTASGLGAFPAPGILPYSCTKTFASFLAQGLAIELKGKVDCLSFECGEVQTNMNPRSKTSFTVLRRDQVTKACLRDLGSYSLTYGHMNHDIGTSLLAFSSVKKLYQTMIFKASGKVYQRMKEKQTKEQKTN